MIHWIICLLRYRRVEKYCDKCERQILQQLNNLDAIPKQDITTSRSQSVLLPLKREEKETQVGEKDANQNDNTLAQSKLNTLNLVDQIKPLKTPRQIGWRLRSWRRFPWRVFSRNWGRLANTQFYPQLINTFLIWLYAKGFGCNLEEAEKTWTDYKTLGHFFTRKLKPGIRPISTIGQLVSPVDGTATHSGQFKGGFLEQVKGSHYSLNYFLGLQKSTKCNVNGREDLETSHASVSEKTIESSLLHKKDGSTVLMQIIIYLSPGDYHRFHSPADWSVTYRR